MKVALISPSSMEVHELCADHELRAWGPKSSKTKVDVINPYPIKSIKDVKAFGPDVVVFEKAKGRVFDEYSQHFDKVVDLDGLRELIPKKPEPVPEPVVVKSEPEPEPVPEIVEVAAAAVAEVEEVIQEEEKPKKTSSRKKKTPTKSST
jgi:hypothetical protein